MRTTHASRAAVTMATVATLALAGCSSASTTPSAAAPAPQDTMASAAPATPVATPADSAPATSKPSVSTKAMPTTDAKATAAEVTRIQIPELGFDSSVKPIATTDMGGVIDPPKATEGKPSGPVRVSDKGVKPAAATDDTTYLACHTSVKNGPEKYPCDVLTRTVSDGDHIVLTTGSGTLVYKVTKERSIPYEAFAADEETWDIVPDRVVLIMCDILNGKAAGGNYVVYATLQK